MPPSVSPSSKTDHAGAHGNLGHVLLRMERYEEAREHLSRAHALDPRVRNVQSLMAELAGVQGRYEEAAGWYRKMLAEDAGDAEAHAGLGAALHEMGRLEAAVGSMQRALELGPDASKVPPLYRSTARALEALGRLDEAERYFRRATAADPHDVSSLLELSRLYISQRRFDEADESLRRALALDPGNTAALGNVAKVLGRRGRLEEAVDAYRAVLALDPHFAMALAGMGDALFHLERYEEAVESLDRSVSLHPHPPAATAGLVLLGKASRALGRAEAAVEYYERAVQIDPGNVDALDHLAMSRFGEKRYEEALGLYRTLLGVRPRQRPDPRQPGHRPVPPGPDRGGGAELRAGAGPGPGPSIGASGPGGAAGAASGPAGSSPPAAAGGVSGPRTGTLACARVGGGAGVRAAAVAAIRRAANRQRKQADRSPTHSLSIYTRAAPRRSCATPAPTASPATRPPGTLTRSTPRRSSPFPLSWKG